MNIREAINFLASTRLFVTSRERIKHPEGTDMFDEAIAMLNVAHPVDNGWCPKCGGDAWENQYCICPEHDALKELISTAKEASACLGHAYHTVLNGELAELAHKNYQNLDRAIDAFGGES